MPPFDLPVWSIGAFVYWRASERAIPSFRLPPHLKPKSDQLVTERRQDRRARQFAQPP
jgi:hypothetical protein